MQNIWKNVIDMPPVWLLIFMALTWGQIAVYNPGAYDNALADLSGWALIAGGLLLAFGCFRSFRRHATSIVPRNTPSELIITGPYRFSRNPIYLADAMILLGFVLLLGSVLGLALVAIFMMLIQTRFIIGEEMGMRAEFGEVFDHYCLTTRRWL